MMAYRPSKVMIDEFNALVSEAMRHHPLTWCVKRGYAIGTSSLRGEECLRCREFVTNGGICDPL